MVDSIAALRIKVIEVPDGSSLVADLRANGNVAGVELDRVRDVEAAPNDTHYDDQWSLRKIGWDNVFGTVNPAGNAVVALLDTGVDASHSDLDGALVAGISILDGSSGNNDPNGHGTAMAGIIAAATDNGSGIAGIGFDGVKVMPVTVLGADGQGQDSDIIEGIVWAVDHGADVINMSFSNPGFSAALQAAIDYAWANDVVVVAATGNDGSSTGTYPAGDRGVVGVSNTDQNDDLNGTSNYGDDVFLAAPGSDITTLAAGGGTTSVTGTSASSAEVAAAAALLRAIDPSASNGVIVGRLARSADAAGTTAQTGNGRLNLSRAVADDGNGSVKPEGIAGSGGPFVGPYVAAAVRPWTGRQHSSARIRLHWQCATYSCRCDRRWHVDTSMRRGVTGIPAGATVSSHLTIPARRDSHFGSGGNMSPGRDILNDRASQSTRNSARLATTTVNGTSTGTRHARSNTDPNTTFANNGTGATSLTIGEAGAPRSRATVQVSSRSCTTTDSTGNTAAPTG